MGESGGDGFTEPEHSLRRGRTWGSDALAMNSRTLNPSTVRRTAAAGLAVAVLLTTAACSRHVGAPPAGPQGGAAATATTGPGTGSVPVTGTAAPTQPAGAAQTAAQATSALGTAIDRAGAAASDQSSDLSASTGSAEGDPTQ